MAGVAEGLSLVRRLGLDPAMLTAIFNTSSARCWSSDSYNPCPVHHLVHHGELDHTATALKSMHQARSMVYQDKIWLIIRLGSKHVVQRILTGRSFCRMPPLLAIKCAPHIRSI